MIPLICKLIQHYNFMARNRSQILFIFLTFSHTNELISWNALNWQVLCFDVMSHILSKISLHIITGFIWMITPLMKIMFQTKKPKSLHGVRYTRKFHLRTKVLRDTRRSCALNTQLPHVIPARGIHHGPVMDRRSFWQNQCNFLLTWHAEPVLLTKNVNWCEKLSIPPQNKQYLLNSSYLIAFQNQY